MKKEDILNALNEVDEDMLESAQRARQNYSAQKKKNTGFMKKALITLSAAAVVIAGVMIVTNRKPETIEPGAVVPDPQTGENEPHDTDQKIFILSRNTFGAGMGLSVVMYPDLKAEKDYNPWNENMNLPELPVFKHTASPVGAGWDLSEDEMRSVLAEYLDWFGYEKTGERVETADHGHIEAGTVLSVTYETAQAQLTCSGDGEVTVFYRDDQQPQLPAGMTLSPYASQEEAETAAEYLIQEYGSLFGGETFAYDLDGDFGYNAQPEINTDVPAGAFRIINYVIYPTGKNDEETVLNYAFRKIQVWSGMDDTKINGIRIFRNKEAYEEYGRYPLISLDEAYEQLYAGNCIYNTGGILPNKSFETGDVQLVYYDSRASQYSYPAWLFKIDITEALEEKGMIHMDGVRQYGLYWVPAVSQEWWQWADEEEQPSAAWQPEPELPEVTDPAEPEITEPAEEPQEPFPSVTQAPEQPEQPAALTGSVSISRVRQETGWYCTVACTQMILNHFGIYKDQNSLAAELNTYAPGIREDGIKGTYDTDAARVLSEYLFGGQPQKETDGGYRVQVVSETFVQSEYSQFTKRLIQNIDDGYPSILQIRVCDLYGGNITDNHNVVVSGYEAGDTVRFTIVDPYFDGPNGNGVTTFDAYTLFSSIVSSVEPSYIW